MTRVKVTYELVRKYETEFDPDDFSCSLGELIDLIQRDPDEFLSQNSEDTCVDEDMMIDYMQFVKLGLSED